MKILNPMYDFVFKALFGSENKTSKKLLIELLNDILRDKEEETIESITYLNPFNHKEFEADKLSILDIKAKTENGDMINIEVQVKAEDDYRKRSLYYWAKTYAESMEEADAYSKLKKTIVINIMGYNIIKESNKKHTHFKIIEKDEKFILTEDLQIHYIELPKLEDKPIEDLEGVELWIAFLRESGKEGSEELLKKLKGRNKTMKSAVESLERVSSDEKMIEMHRAREKSKRDMKSKLIYAEEKAMERGMEKGIEKGIEKGKIEVVKDLIRAGADIELILKASRLTKEKIDEIKEEILN